MHTRVLALLFDLKEGTIDIPKDSLLDFVVLHDGMVISVSASWVDFYHRHENEMKETKLHMCTMYHRENSATLQNHRVHREGC